MLHPTSPKQPPPEHQRDWYPYYAGFTKEFVDYVLSEHASAARKVLDPWNGSGTTTAACVQRGLSATGVDINPVSTVIARARLTPRSVADSLIPLAAKILYAARQHELAARPSDLLAIWLRPEACGRIRALQAAIHSALTDLPANTEEKLTPVVLAKRLPLLACFYYTILFAVTREILRPFKASNPTWTRKPVSYRHRLAPSWPQIQESFFRQAAALSDRLTICFDNHLEPLAELRTASATRLPFPTCSFDAVVTSPPYATRIDYVHSALPELAAMAATKEEVAVLRRLSTGSPVIRKPSSSLASLSSENARRLLRRIASHHSKGSRSYYHPWMKIYLSDLQRGLQETARVVNPPGSIAIVVQDSHYKEIPVRLQEIVVEMMDAEGRSLVHRNDFAVKHHRAWMNPRAARHLAVRRNKESLLVFR